MMQGADGRDRLTLPAECRTRGQVPSQQTALAQ